MISLVAASKPGWFPRLPNRSFLSWALQQLHIQPYQHLLEVGYGAGHLTEEVARALRVGFIAGIESSIPLYQQAYRRNKRFVQQQLLQLHIGEPYELSYPRHYFHTVYGLNLHLTCQNLGQEVLRLANLLRTKGRLVLLLEERRDEVDLHKLASNLLEDFHIAGLTGIRTEHPSFSPDNSLAIIGFKA
ncbi:MAG: hypothetical protein JST68_03405 [Bacteroidetes bacterium]|nr:hypothetical protein [Bacteroidota bacterium]